MNWSAQQILIFIKVGRAYRPYMILWEVGNPLTLEAYIIFMSFVSFWKVSLTCYKILKFTIFKLFTLCKLKHMSVKSWFVEPNEFVFMRTYIISLTYNFVWNSVNLLSLVPFICIVCFTRLPITFCILYFCFCELV